MKTIMKLVLSLIKLPFKLLWWALKVVLLLVGFGLFKGGTKGELVPTVVGDGYVRNMSVFHKSGNKYTITFERYDGQMWNREKRVISPSTSGIAIGKAYIQISWS